MVPSGIITLTTDFGLIDPYVGVMKGVILSINPKAKLVDISHNIEPGNILEAAIILKESFTYFPKGTVHVVVVDPGVGTRRRAIVLVTDHYFFVGPDNGVLWPVLSGDSRGTVVNLNNSTFFRHPVSDTFHGRDIFAPVAAHLSLGASPFHMGPIIKDPMRLEIPKATEDGARLRGQIIRIDRFGNLITNIDAATLIQYMGTDTIDVTIKVGPLLINGISRKYADVAVNHALALIGSSGFLEISVNQGRADKLVGKQEHVIGMPVIVEKSQ